jgi:hypothetical protein
MKKVRARKELEDSPQGQTRWGNFQSEVFHVSQHAKQIYEMHILWFPLCVP